MTRGLHLEREREEVPPWPWWADLHLRLLVFSRCPDCIGDMGKEAGPVFCCFVCLAYVNMVSSRCPLDTLFLSFHRLVSYLVASV